ncbi:hypothetical protein COOONC_12020 [Cooperia oncophora]
MPSVESEIQPTFHRTTMDMNSQLLTIPVQSATESNYESDMEPPSRTPSLKSLDINPLSDVPPALVVTDALTPKRAPTDFGDQEDYNSPAGLNRTHFSRPSYQRRRFKEPELSEIGVQTGETIRLRQAMSFEQGPTTVFEGATKDRLAPFGQTATNMSFERFANNSFEKRGHPAPAVLTAMLQQRQNQAARNSVESSYPRETASNSSQEKQIPGGEKPTQQMTREERRRSFIDNQHHSYETRTHQEWRSSTRSQWEEGKLDENFNELRSTDWENKDTVPDGVQQQMDKLHYTRLSDQVFEEREVLVERNEYYDGSQPARSYMIQQTQKVSIGGEKPGQLPVIMSQKPESIRKSQNSEKVPGKGEELSKPFHPTVITRETVEQLRQSVVAESRLPSTPRKKSLESDTELPPPIDIKDLSMTDPVPRVSTAAKEALYTTPTRGARISMNVKTPTSLWSPTSRGWERRKFSNERGDGSPYKWQVPSIDTCRENREPDVRSNESRTSNRGSTVRRHVPRGRIRDLARLFDGLSREAQRDAEVLRGKSLPPPKHRTKYFRTHSLPRHQNSPPRAVEQPPVEESRPEVVNSREPVVKYAKIPYSSTLGGVTDDYTSASNQPHFPSSQGNSCSEPVEVHADSKPEPVYAKVQRVSANPYHHQPVGQQGSFRRESVCSVTSERRLENADAEKVTGEIDRMFEFVDEHDGLSTLGRETETESTTGVVKHGDYGIVRGEVGGHLTELPPVPPQPPLAHSNLDATKRGRSDQPLKYSISGYRDMQRVQRMGRVTSDAPPRFSPLTAPTPGIGVSTYKSREGTIGEKVSTISRYSRPNTQPSALATSTPVNSPLGTGFSQKQPDVPNLDDSFVSTITTASQLHDAHEEYKRQIATRPIVTTTVVQLSAQRTLLLARERLELLRCEVNRISALAAVRNPPPPVSRDLRGTMTISNITVHLNRSFCQRQYDQDASYALLILLKCGAEVEATGPISLLAHQPVRIRQLTFAEHVQFSNLPVDFNVVVEVYAMKLPTAKQMEQSCATNIANKCRNLLNPACRFLLD